MKLNWKVLAAFTGIFIAGAVAGGFVGVRLLRHFSEKRATSEQFGPQQMKKFTEQLELTPEQGVKIRPVIMQTAEDLKKTRREAFRATSEMIERMEAAIAKELNGAQRDRLREMQEKEREHRRQWMLERGKRGGDVRPGQEGGFPPKPPPPQEPSKP